MSAKTNNRSKNKFDFPSDLYVLTFSVIYVVKKYYEKIGRWTSKMYFNFKTIRQTSIHQMNDNSVQTVLCFQLYGIRMTNREELGTFKLYCKHALVFRISTYF